MSSSSSIKALEHLFISKVRIKALKYFTLNPNKPIHLRGAVREFVEEINAVRRELNRLEETKFIIAESRGNRKYFKTNVEHLFYNELLAMFHKTYGLGGEILDNIKKLGEVEFAFLTPTYTKELYLGGQVVDMVLIGNIDMQVTEEIVKKIQSEQGREIHYMILKPSEFQIRKRRRDQLIVDLMIQDNVMLVGNYDDFIK